MAAPRHENHPIGSRSHLHVSTFLPHLRAADAHQLADTYRSDYRTRVTSQDHKSGSGPTRSVDLSRGFVSMFEVRSGVCSLRGASSIDRGGCSSLSSRSAIGWRTFVANTRFAQHVDG